MYNSYCRDVLQRPTANNNHHNHGRRWKWPSSASHEAFCPAPMHQISRRQPPQQVDALITGFGGVYPSRHGDSNGDGNSNGDGIGGSNFQTIFDCHPIGVCVFYLKWRLYIIGVHFLQIIYNPNPFSGLFKMQIPQLNA